MVVLITYLIINRLDIKWIVELLKAGSKDWLVLKLSNIFEVSATESM